MQKVVIIGCGWLGQQLGSALAKAGFQVFGTRQSVAALSLLPAPIQPLLLQLPCTDPQPELLELFNDAWLICALPPAVRQQGTDFYPTVLQNLAQLAGKASVRGVIHCSSTGVYAGLSGEVSEQSELVQSGKAAYLLAGEQALQQCQPCITLRLAGLIGPGRHPGRFGRGGTLTGAELPVNLVHSADIAAFILVLMQQVTLTSDCVNLCCPEHPTKQQFYPVAAAHVGQSAVHFTTEDEPGRAVNSSRSQTYQGFHYQFQSPEQALDFC